MEQQRKQETEIDLVELFFALKQKLWIIIIAFAAGIGIMAAYTVFMVTPQYSATSMIYVLTTSTTNDATTLSDVQLGTQLANDYTILLKTHPVLDTVIENLGLDINYDQLYGKINVTNTTDTRILNITVTDADPQTAQSIANEMAHVAIDYLGEVVSTDDSSIAEEAQLPRGPVSPSLSRNCLMGGLLGIVLSAGVIIILYLLNDKLYTEEDVEKYLHLTTLGTIPDKSGKNISKEKRRHAND